MLSVYTTWIECSRNYYAASQPTFHLATVEAHLNTVRHSSIHFHPELSVAVTCCEATAPSPNGIKLWVLSIPLESREVYDHWGVQEKLTVKVVKMTSALNAVVQKQSKSWVGLLAPFSQAQPPSSSRTSTGHRAHPQHCPELQLPLPIPSLSKPPASPTE